jgi:hypothetical protein
MPAGNQNQSMLIAMIVFVILMVISMGLAVLFMKERSELQTQLDTVRKQYNTVNNETLPSLQNDLTNLQKMVLPTQQNDESTQDQLRAKFQARYAADLDKFGKRLNAIDSTAVVATYTQMLDSALKTLEDKQREVNAANATVAKTTADKDALDAYYKGQVKQFEDNATTANTEKAASLKTLADTEQKLRDCQKQLTEETAKVAAEVAKVRDEKQKTIDQLTKDKDAMQLTIDQLNKALEFFRKTDYASSFDGKITRVNPSARTVWINVGTFDNLKKHIGFSVQPQGVPPGSTIPPKAKIEVVELLGDRLAECRIIEDDLNNPISVGDNIFTSLWDPGQKTRFGFAGKIDLNDDGSDDLDQVESRVGKAGGQIDVKVVDGVIEGELTIYTRYLVLGAIPADAKSAASYNALLDQATKLGVQRIPLPVFKDQIGYRSSDPRRVVFGGGSQTGTVAMDPPDGGPRVSSGSVSAGVMPNRSFQPRRPAPANGGTAY